MTDQTLGARGWLVLITLCGATFMTGLDYSIITVALPEIGRDLGFATRGDLQWVVTACLLPTAALMPLFGRASDVVGRRRLFALGVTAFTGFSLSRLTELDVSRTKITSIEGLRDLGSVTVLTMHCPRLTDLGGIAAMPALETLWLEGCTDLKSLDGLGHHPRLTTLGLPGASIPDLRPLSRLPALTRLTIERLQRFTSIDGLEGHPSIAEVHLCYATDLRDFSALARMPALRTLELDSCGALRDLGTAEDLPSLKEVLVEECPALPSAVLDGLRARGLLTS
jgi:Leucine-rich repeat (LRR) protein